MQAVILAGGYGSRLFEETKDKPKPMIEIGGQPILRHIMNIYSCYGITDFIICCGYKHQVIKEYFLNMIKLESDIEVDLYNNTCNILNEHHKPWTIKIIDTGNDTMTGGRLKRIKKYINGTFCCTYGDGVSDIDILDLIKFHKCNKKIATLTAVQHTDRFGSLQIDSNLVTSFREKRKNDSWINGGFFVFEREIFDYLESDISILEKEPMEQLVAERQLAVYKHTSFWQCMDTLKDKLILQDLWSNGAPWKTKI